MIAIIDYGMGNLFSLSSSLKSLGYEVEITADPERLRAADKLFLPGVGAFRDAQERLFSTGLADVIRELAAEGKPLMGICLGMQLLFDRSLEYGEHAGLGLIPGSVEDLKPDIPPALKVPHIGWNALHKTADHPLLKYVQEGDCVYFVHSFYAKHCAAHTIATAEYGAAVTAAVARENVLGCQFHPEKSGAVGLSILRAFCEMEGRA